MIPPTQAQGPDITAQPALDIPDDASVDLSGVLQESQIMEVLQQLDQELPEAVHPQRRVAASQALRSQGKRVSAARLLPTSPPRPDQADGYPAGVRIDRP